MAEIRPAIGVCIPFAAASFGVWQQRAALVPADYVSSIQRAGGLTLMVAPEPQITEDPDELLERIDGLMLTGGSDIDPATYGAEPHPETTGATPERDEFELSLIRRAVELDMPVLGICRGMQILNIAFGGTLLQHLPDAFGHQDHRRVPGSFEGADHDVRLTPGSIAAAAAGELRHAIKSHHHQGVDVVGEGLVVTGVSALDDLVEAIELPDNRFVLGVQWHPEADERSRVIGALVRAAAEYRAARDQRMARGWA